MSVHSNLTVVFGFGAVGREVTHALVARGDTVRVAQRTRPQDLPIEATFLACDVLDAGAVRRAALGAGRIVIAIGFAYDSRVWRRKWPVAMANLLDAASRTQARVVFVDNLYMLGPQTAPLHEDMPLSSQGQKTAVRADLTRLWRTAAQAGRVRITALRCADFYGPRVTLSQLGANAFGALGQGKTAMLLAPPDTPHDFAYVPDVARAVLLLLEAPEADVLGEVWNMPCAPTHTPRQILEIGARALGRRLEVKAVPIWLLPVLGLFSRLFRETAEMRSIWDRPYVVDARKFTRRFGFEPTPFELGAAATAVAFAKAAGAMGSYSATGSDQ